MKKRQDELIQAIVKNDAFRVRGLLNEDPDLVTTPDSQGRTPILLALYFGHEDLAGLIREESPTPTLFEAVALGEVELAGELLSEAQAGANAFSPDGFGLLGLAVYFGRVEMAKYLLESGADPDTPSANSSGVRPIHSALAHRDPETSLAMARLLLEAGAETNVIQAGGWSPLHQAAAHGRRELAELLLAKGADTSATSDDGRTPAEMAKAKGHDELEVLLTPGGS